MFFLILPQISSVVASKLGGLVRPDESIEQATNCWWNNSGERERYVNGASSFITMGVERHVVSEQRDGGFAGKLRISFFFVALSGCEVNEVALFCWFLL